MSKPNSNVTTEEMLEHYLLGEELCRAIRAKEAGQNTIITTIKLPPCPLCDAILFLITDYPRLKAKYDALRGMVREWKKEATKHENLVNLKAIQKLLRSLRDHEEENGNIPNQENSGNQEKEEK